MAVPGFTSAGTDPSQGFITDPIGGGSSGPFNWGALGGNDQLPSNVQALIQAIIQQAAAKIHAPMVDPGLLQRPGSTPAGKGFSFYNQTWGPNDFSAFAKALAAHNISVGQFARAHPGAFGSFNIDPQFRQLLMASFAGPSGGMGHA